MALQDYVPERDGDLSTWASNIKTTLPTYATDLGLSTEETAAALAAAQAIVNAINQNTTAQDAAKAATTLKKATVKTSVGTLRSLFKRGKMAPGYTATIGDALHIVGTDEPTDWSMFKPELSAEVMPGHVVLKFKKDGAQGVNIYTRLEGIAGWVKLAFDSSSPYIDNRPVAAGGPPENREYMCIAVLHDEEVSQASDVVRVAFGG